jgi:hypothetical protein
MASSFERLTAKQVRDNYREQFFVADLEKPTIVDAMAGDPDGLIHKDKLGAALAVKIPLWDDRPPEGLFNVLTLECLLSSSPEWVRIGAPEVMPWPGELPDSDFPLDREIPLTVFKDYEGLLQFRYRVKNWNDDSERESPVAPVTIDRTGPLWVDPEHAVIDIVEQPVITDAVLVRDNGVFCVIPDFIEAKRADVWVHVAWLDRVPLPTEDIGQFIELSMLMPADRKVLVRADVVRRYGSKTQYAVAILIDKAGNRGEMSLPVTVNVALGTLPSALQPCTVPLAADGVIDRADAAFPTKVHIPSYTGWNSEDGIVVSWGKRELARTSVGAHLPFDLMITVPWAHLAAEYDFNSATHVQTVKVDYKVLRGDYTDPTGHSWDSLRKIFMVLMYSGIDDTGQAAAQGAARASRSAMHSASKSASQVTNAASSAVGKGVDPLAGFTMTTPHGSRTFGTTTSAAQNTGFRGGSSISSAPRPSMPGPSHATPAGSSVPHQSSRSLKAPTKPGAAISAPKPPKQLTSKEFNKLDFFGKQRYLERGGIDPTQGMPTQMTKRNWMDVPKESAKFREQP